MYELWVLTGKHSLGDFNHALGVTEISGFSQQGITFEMKFKILWTDQVSLLIIAQLSVFNENLLVFV